MTEKERRTKRALHREQRELAGFYQNRLSALEAVRVQGLMVVSLIISAAAVLIPASHLSSDGGQFIVFIATLGGFSVVGLMIAAAQRRARQIRDDYLREHRELFGDQSALELTSWLLDRPRKPEPTISRMPRVATRLP